MLCYRDLHKHKILLDESGSLAGVIDWEAQITLPLFAACDYPKFLCSKVVTEEPTLRNRVPNENGRMPDLWEHVEKYQLTLLRGVFMDEMRRLAPGWVEVYESSARQRDFEFAVEHCNADDPLLQTRITGWLARLEAGVEHLPGLVENVARHA